MTTDTRGPNRTRGAPRDFASQLHSAVAHLIEATPIDRLERRLSELERWVNRLEKDAGRLTADLQRTPGAPRPATAARTRAARAAKHARPRVHHLPVESEMARPGG